MNKKEAKAIVKKNQAEIRHAEIMIEMYENGIRERKEHIAKFEEFINKKDDWRLVEVPDIWQALYEEKALLMADMMHFAYARNKGWVPDWGSRCKEKFGIVHEKYGVFKARCRMSYNSFVFGVSVKSEEIAKEMLKEFGKRIEEIYNKQY
ncbi:MAG: hypothetical protein PHS04_07975 [Tissierellia bacterium]|nr:hypothetical protein [Tissierellia bacterium]